mmetsp:Transcript_80023/g.224608  ORF Transcript_80023/g.224608 Transcript_80023/m.224608 type:complete len:466 (+) Transcript_80023:852-2249(+)
MMTAFSREPNVGAAAALPPNPCNQLPRFHGDATPPVGGASKLVVAVGLVSPVVVVAVPPDSTDSHVSHVLPLFSDSPPGRDGRNLGEFGLGDCNLGECNLGEASLKFEVPKVVEVSLRARTGVNEAPRATLAEPRSIAETLLGIVLMRAKAADADGALSEEEALLFNRGLDAGRRGDFASPFEATPASSPTEASRVLAEPARLLGEAEGDECPWRDEDEDRVERPFWLRLPRAPGGGLASFVDSHVLAGERGATEGSSMSTSASSRCARGGPSCAFRKAGSSAGGGAGGEAASSIHGSAAATGCRGGASKRGPPMRGAKGASGATPKLEAWSLTAAAGDGLLRSGLGAVEADDAETAPSIKRRMGGSASATPSGSSRSAEHHGLWALQARAPQLGHAKGGGPAIAGAAREPQLRVQGAAESARRAWPTPRGPRRPRPRRPPGNKPRGHLGPRRPAAHARAGGCGA